MNCGGASLGGAYLPSDLAAGLRTTAAHSTLVVGDSNSTAALAEGALGRGVVEVAFERSDSAGDFILSASHDGYARRYGLIHERTLTLSADGKELKGDDVLRAAPNRRRPADTSFAIRFHLAPRTEVSLTADGQGALLRIDGGPLWQFKVRGGSLMIDDSLWVDADARPHAAQQLVVSGRVNGATTAHWQFKRIG